MPAVLFAAVRALLFCLLLLGGRHASAQPARQPPGHLPSTAHSSLLPIRAFTADDGLGGATITSLLKDARGFLWIGTPDELLLYDGQRFLPFRYTDSAGGSIAFRRAIVLRAGDGHFLLLHEGGAHRYIEESGLLQRLRLPFSAADVTARATLTIHRDGWYRLSDAQLTARYHPSSGRCEIIARHPQPHRFVRLVEHGRQTLLDCDTGTDGHSFRISYIGTGEAVGTYRFPFRPLSAVKLTSGIIALEARGLNQRVWWMPGEGTARPLATLRTPAAEVRALDAGDAVYLAAGATLLRFHPGAGGAEEVLDETGRSPVGTGIISHLLRDGRSLWVGTNALGLLHISLDGPRFGLLRSAVPVHNFTHAVYPDLRSGKCYVGTYGGLLLLYDTAGGQPEDLTPILHRAGGALSAYINAIESLPDGSLFIVSGLSSWVFNPATRVATNLAASEEAALRAAGYYPKGYMGRKAVVRAGPWEWWISDKVGLALWRLVPAAAAGSPRLELRKMIRLSEPTEAIARYAGGWWCATAGRLYRLDHRGAPDSFALPLRSFPTSLQADARGRLWVATESGIVVWRGGKAERILTTETGLPNNHIYALQPDSAGWMWGSSNGGLFAVRTDDFLVRAFTGGDGLQGAEFNLGSSARDERGRLYFGGMNGVNIVDAAVALHEEEAGVVTFTRIAGADTVYYTYPGAAALPALRLPHDRASVQIAYTAPQLTASGPQQYEYRIKEKDSVWIDNGARTELQLYLAPGAYQVEVRLRGRGRSAAFRVEVAPPFYRTWLFMALAVLVGAAAIAAFIIAANKRRFQRQLLRLETARRIQQEKERISRELHDELGARAALLAHNASLLKEESGTNRTVASLATRVTDTTADMLTALRETVWTLKQEAVSVESVWLRYKNFIAKLAETYSHIRFAVEEDEALPTAPLDYARALHLLRILQEATMNAVKHSGAALIAASARATGGDIHFKVADNGRGFDASEAKTGSEGNGLHNMAYRSGEGRLQLDIRRGAESGSVVEVVLPRR